MCDNATQGNPVWRASRKFACYRKATDGTRKFTRRAAAAAMGERGKMCEERIAQIAAADGNPYKVLRVTEAATHAEMGDNLSKCGCCSAKRKPGDGALLENRPTH